MIRHLLLSALLVASGAVGQHAIASNHHSAPMHTAPPHTAPTPDLVTPMRPTGVGNTEHLTPALRRAITHAVAAAAADNVELQITSGWRSRERQNELFRAAIRKYGSARAASSWVLPAERSAHVRGEAIDVGPTAGARWLEEHGVRFGLCRRYDNEPWHFELLAAAKGSVCPARQPHA